MPAIAMIRDNLGVLYRDTNRYTQAKESYLEVLEMYKALAEADPQVDLPDVAMALNNLGDLYCKAGRIREAQDCFF